MDSWLGRDGGFCELLPRLADVRGYFQTSVLDEVGEIVQFNKSEDVYGGELTRVQRAGGVSSLFQFSAGGGGGGGAAPGLGMGGDE